MARFVPLVSMVLLLGALYGCSTSGPTVASSQDNSAQTPVAAPSGMTSPESFATEHGDFSSYWHAGQAELTRYRLSQHRYGEAHEGEAVLIFVTEPFLPNEQVKHDGGDGRQSVDVLKLNSTRRFYTGIYPYSLMTSSFLPTGDPSAKGLKLTSTMTEWCGQAFTQLNRRDGKVHAELRSYFQSEGDTETEIEDALYEDAMWQRVRRDPSSLPTGELRLIPALHALRFLHRPVTAYDAVASVSDNGGLKRYEVTIPELGRTLRIDFNPAFPHVIEAWEEEMQGGVTRAERTHAIMDAYWSHNSASDARYREALGLSGG